MCVCMRAAVSQPLLSPLCVSPLPPPNWRKHSKDHPPPFSNRLCSCFLFTPLCFPVMTRASRLLASPPTLPRPRFRTFSLPSLPLLLPSSLPLHLAVRRCTRGVCVCVPAFLISSCICTAPAPPFLFLRSHRPHPPPLRMVGRRRRRRCRREEVRRVGEKEGGGGEGG